MNEVLNEVIWTENMIENCTLGKRPKETINRVAKYYKRCGYDDDEIYKRIEEFLIRCDKTISIPKWDKVITFAVNYAEKHPLIEMDSIKITRLEMEKVASIKGRQRKRVLFTLLVLSKYWNVKRGDESYWVNSTDSEIFRMANVGTSIKRQCEMIKALSDDGFISMSKKVDNLNIKVEFADECGECVLEIKNMANIGWQYEAAIGNKGFFECVNCGKTVKEKNPGIGRKQKYCDDCAVSIAVKQRVDSVMKSRSAHKD